MALTFIFVTPGETLTGVLQGTQGGKPPLAYVMGDRGLVVVKVTPSLFAQLQKFPIPSRISIRFTHEEPNANGTRPKRFAVTALPSIPAVPSDAKDPKCQISPTL